MNKIDFQSFYNKIIKPLAEQFISTNHGFSFSDNFPGLYEEYMNQKAMLHLVYGKKDALLDRHKICACLTVSIIKVRLLSSDLEADNNFSIGEANCVNEQLAFLSSWELMKAFIVTKEEQTVEKFILPETFHNVSFVETVTRSLFMANQLNGLSAPLIANMYFLLEKYCKDVKD